MKSIDNVMNFNFKQEIPSHILQSMRKHTYLFPIIIKRITKNFSNATSIDSNEF